MKILVAHNFYQQAGGEDQVFRSETQMLEKKGHTIIRFTETNDRVPNMGRVELALATVWNRDSYERLRTLVRRERPEIVHFHNTFPLLSPACYYAARSTGAAVVQTLHNYRLLCPAATLLRDGKICEDCVGKLAWRGVQHACYRGNRTASTGVATMLALHTAAGTWVKAVDAYIALTKFSRLRFIAGGLPDARLYVKPNFTEPDPGIGAGGDSYLYAGRLSPEKGLAVLLDAWSSHPEFPLLRIVGDGPQGAWLQERAGLLRNVEWLGKLPREQVLTLMKNSRALILPSIWYENFPVSVVEAFATGLPVIVSDAGTLPELVDDGVTGFVFRSGDAADLSSKVLAIQNPSPSAQQLRPACRSRFENFYGEDKNYDLLLEIYAEALKNRGRHRPTAS